MFASLKSRDGHRVMVLACTLFLHVMVCCLLVYALIFEAGDLITSGCKKIGFYNYCFRNETSTLCFCITHPQDLHKAGIAFPEGVILALVLTYSSLVVFFIGFLTLMLAQCLNDGSLWMFALGCNAITFTLLLLGLILKLLLIWTLLDLSHLSMGSLALMLAIVGLCVLYSIMRHYSNLIKEPSTPEDCDTRERSSSDLTFCSPRASYLTTV
ncbi:Hypothetical predicted protein [Pelobates cultripes]|uniref:Uncharacterized protein n=1 Tax=Pelobates cultripes TaxID=61616 RepID=A0AAD1RR12_PELCU|nr:Hypothetical predicted protein [Pelobates cultripes]